MNKQVDATSIKIGEMLIEVGVLTSGDLTEAIQISRRMGVPIGRVLVMSGCVTDDRLQQTLELQSLIRDGMVDMETAHEALKLIFQKKMSTKEALAALNWRPKQDQQSNKLGDLLVDSTIITKSQLERALEASFQSGMPLGGTLVLQGILSPMLLPTVLHIQESVRENHINRDQAIEELKRALMFWARAEHSKQGELQSAKQPAAAPKGGAQPSRAGMLTGERTETRSEGRAAAPLQQAPDPTAEAPQQAQVNQVSLVELLKLSGFCTQSSLDKALQDALQDGRLASKLLLAIGFIDADMLNSYIHIQALVARGKLRTDQALYALNSMRHRKLSLKDALSEMGVTAEL